MPFTPPRCPHSDCTHHHQPEGRFFRRHGAYRPSCRPWPVPRFRCRGCRRTFSRQTFRADYRDRRPECNKRLFLLLVSGVGLRQCGRLLRLDVHAVQYKFRKIGRTLTQLHGNLLRRLPGERTFLLDELETYEHKAIWPLSVPVLIEKESGLVVATAVAPIRRSARAGSPRRRWQEREEQRHGRRKDRSVETLRRLFVEFQQLLQGRTATLWTDLKGAYARLCRQLFGGQVVHRRWPGRARRDTRNPLFLINLTNAMLRDNNGRLRRRSWLVSKKGECLHLQLALFVAYRNYYRRRRNSDKRGVTPATVLKVVERQLLPEEMLAWRQDWGVQSIHPMSRDGRRQVAA